MRRKGSERTRRRKGRRRRKRNKICIKRCSHAHTHTLFCFFFSSIRFVAIDDYDDCRRLHSCSSSHVLLSLPLQQLQQKRRQENRSIFHAEEEKRLQDDGDPHTHYDYPIIIPCPSPDSSLAPFLQVVSAHFSLSLSPDPRLLLLSFSSRVTEEQEEEAAEAIRVIVLPTPMPRESFVQKRSCNHLGAGEMVARDREHITCCGLLYLSVR